MCTRVYTCSTASVRRLLYEGLIEITQSKAFLVGKWEFADPRGLCAMTGRMQALCLLRIVTTGVSLMYCRQKCCRQMYWRFFPLNRKHVDDLAIGALSFMWP